MQNDRPLKSAGVVKFFTMIRKPYTLPEIVGTLELMALCDVMYHFDDEATDCLSGIMSREEALIVQSLVDHMRYILEAKTLDIFELAMIAHKSVHGKESWAFDGLD